MMLVFFRLMVRLNYVQVSAKQVLSHCSESSVWAVRAMASAKSNSLMRTLRTFVLAQRCARLKRLPSLLLWRKMPVSDCQNVKRSTRRC